MGIITKMEDFMGIHENYSAMPEEMEEMEKIVYDDESTEEEIEEANERIEEIMDEIEDIKSDPEGEPTSDMVEDVVRGLVDGRMRDVSDVISELGLDLNDYIDIDQLIIDTIDTDGTGSALSPYDGSENEVNINGTWYYVYRVD